MPPEAHTLDLLPVVTLLGAAVVFVPIFRRLGLGSVLGYLAAGVVIGPFGLKAIAHPESALQIAELGVVMFLFIIGLEMRPSKLWGLRRQIFGLGLLQVSVSALLLTGVGLLAGLGPAQAFVAGAGFVMTSTAIVMQMLNERKQMHTPGGQRMVSILLFEDLAIVPLLITLSFLAPAAGNAAGLNLSAIAIGLGCLGGLVLAGRYLLNPLFTVLANAQAREVMTAAALLVVLGSAWLMQVGGLSMAMGAFIAGVLLSESDFRHQLEADIEPFRGLLLGLFFLAVGMSLDVGLVAANWGTVAMFVAAYMSVKALAIYTIARLLKASHTAALERAVLMAQGGEFAFVLFTSAFSTGIFSAEQNALLTAVIILSMVLTPLALIAMRRLTPGPAVSLEGLESPNGLHANVLIIGFGRVGQIAGQLLMARGFKVSTLDNDVEMIKTAREYNFRVYYGDGTRLDILHASGAHEAQAVLVCVDTPDDALKIVELMKSEFPLTPVLARSFDRHHTARLIQAGVDYQIRETFESALLLGQKALEVLGTPEEDIEEITRTARERDQLRLELELAAGPEAGKAYFNGKAPRFYLKRETGENAIHPE